MTPNPLDAAALAATRNTLAAIVESGTVEEIGRKALLIAFLFDPTIIGTQRQLAERMGVTPGRASQQLKAIRARTSGKPSAS